MEMVQFHPTGLLAGPDTRMTGTVLEEGLRGSGAGICSTARSTASWVTTIQKLERATRDVVSRAIYAEMKAGRTTPNGGVYIKMSHLGPARVAKEFKGMVDRCRDCGFDLAGGLVEVVPTAHYFMGGVICDVDTTTRHSGPVCCRRGCERYARRQPAWRQRLANSTVFGGIAGETMPRWIENHKPGHREPDASKLAAGRTGSRGSSVRT